MKERVSPIRAGEEDFPEPPRLRRLRRMVTGLTAALTLGMVVIAAALVWRVARDEAGPPLNADEIVLPAGLEIIAVGGDGQRLLVTTRGPDGTERIHAFEKPDGAPAGVTTVTRR